MSLFTNNNELYHFYNQGNNRREIFGDAFDCVQFLHLFRQNLSPCCEVIAWCLMPNHFHFQVLINGFGAETRKLGSITISNFGNGVRLLQCQYARYYNVKYHLSGSLFRQKAKIKNCENQAENYKLVVFDYIHNNPVTADLVTKRQDWTFSSFSDYFYGRGNTLVNKQLGEKLLGISTSDITFVDLPF